MLGRRAFALALLASPIVFPLATEPASAARIEPFADLPEAFLGAAAVWTGEAVYLFGGRQADNVYRDAILRYDPGTGHTEKVGTLPASSVGPSGRQSMAAVWTGSKAYLFGGAVVDPGTKTPRAITDIVEFDPATNRATNVQKGTVDALPEPVFGLGAAWLGGRAFLFGGLKFVYTAAPDPTGAGTNITWQDRILVFDPSAPASEDKVTLLSERLPYPVQDMATVVHGDSVYLLGGLAQVTTPDGGKDVRPVSSIVKFDPAARKASLVEVNLPRKLHFHSAGVLGGTIYALGGREERQPEGGAPAAFTSDAIIRWRPGTPPTEHALRLPVPRYAAGTAVTPSGILLLGGRDSSEHVDGMRSVLAFSGEPVPPTAPTALAVAADRRVNVTWSSPAYDGDSPITGYRVERTSAEGVSSRVGWTAGTWMIDTSAPGSGTVTYRVFAANAHGEGPPAVAKASLGPRPPEVPSEFAAYAGNAEVVLQWTPPPTDGGAELTGYVVERRGPEGSVSIDATGRSIVDSNLTNGVAYAYRVVAVNSLGTSVPTAPREVVPQPFAPPPSRIEVEDDGVAVSLSWSAVEGATAYEILRGPSPVALERVATTEAPRWTDEEVATGLVYWYAVRASNEHGSGIPTDPVRLARLSAPGAPHGLSAVAGVDFVRLQWAAPNVTGGVRPSELTYVVERADEDDAPFFAIANDIGPTAYTDRRVDAGSSYRYRVAAVNSLGRGDASAPLDVKVASLSNDPPRAVLIAKPSATDAGVDVTFDGSFSADPDGRVADYRFDFGDGSESEWTLSPTVTHAYAANGVYTASLVVRDDRGAASPQLALAQVIVGPPPPAKEGPSPEAPQVNETDEPPLPGTESGRVPGPSALLAAAAIALAVAARRRR